MRELFDAFRLLTQKQKRNGVLAQIMKYDLCLTESIFFFLCCCFRRKIVYFFIFLFVCYCIQKTCHNYLFIFLIFILCNYCILLVVLSFFQNKNRFCRRNSCVCEFARYWDEGEEAYMLLVLIYSVIRESKTLFILSSAFWITCT